MNENVCRVCRRYGGKSLASKGWVCAEFVYDEYSEVIPGHSVFKKDGFHPVIAEREVPPEWCERKLEHIMTIPGEQVDLIPDQRLVYDGNKAARNRVSARTTRPEW